MMGSLGDRGQEGVLHFHKLQEITSDQFTEKEINSFICPSHPGKDELKKKEIETWFTDVHDALLPARSGEQQCYKTLYN